MPQTWSRDDIEEIARNAAEDMADDGGTDADHEERISQLEAEKDALANLVDAQGDVIDAQGAQIDSLQAEYQSHTHY